jgi:branched-chain amino acid transport system substrate-binding protein
MLRRNQRTKFSVVAIVLCAIPLWFAACTKKSDTAENQSSAADEILIGEFGSMTGSESTFGTNTHNGLLMAIDEVNKAGGVKGKKIRVLSEDDQGRSDEAVTVVTKLITQKKVTMIIGEVASSRSIAAAPIAQQYKIPMISPSSTNPKVTQIGDYIYRVCFIDPFQGLVMAKFAFNNLQKKKAAIFRDRKSDYSMGLADVFKEEFTKLGGKIESDVTYNGGDVDFRPQLTVIKQSKPDSVFIPGYYTEVGLIALQAKELGLDVPLLGGDGWDSKQLTEIGRDAIVGSYFSTHYSSDADSPVIKNFVAAYKERYNGAVPNALAAMGYDAGKVAADAMTRAKDLTSASIRDAIGATTNFQGVTGIITINAEHNAVKPAVVLKVAGPSKYDYVTTVNP